MIKRVKVQTSVYFASRSIQVEPKHLSRHILPVAALLLFLGSCHASPHPFTRPHRSPATCPPYPFQDRSFTRKQTMTFQYTRADVSCRTNYLFFTFHDRPSLLSWPCSLQRQTCIRVFGIESSSHLISPFGAIH